ncbi:hypothetical protein ACFSJW_16685 [Flavobacterium artemisiae]|uniref:Uncharacterized protein n=1 Tax=Flavobacterium artemisiae TaxID=2126556 RepID=A0ABW4H8W9_9FLAO
MEEKKFDLQLQNLAQGFLKEVSKWTFVLAVLGFIVITVLCIYGLFAFAIFKATGSILPGTGEMMDSFGTALNTFYIIAAGILFFPVYFLFKFSVNAQKAFKNNDSEALTKSLRSLKAHYKLTGITTFLVLVLCILLFLEVLFP